MLNPIPGIEIDRVLTFNIKTGFSDRTFSNYTEIFMIRSGDRWDLLVLVLIKGPYVPFALPLSIKGGRFTHF